MTGVTRRAGAEGTGGQREVNGRVTGTGRQREDNNVPEPTCHVRPSRTQVGRHRAPSPCAHTAARHGLHIPTRCGDYW